MNAYLLLLLEVAISAAVSSVVLRALTIPLLRTLERICPDEQSASFWLSYTRIMLMIAPLMLVLVVDSISRNGSPVDSLRMAAVASLGGLLLGMHILGKRLGRFINQPEASERGQ